MFYPKSSKDQRVGFADAGYLSDYVCKDAKPRYNRSRTISFKNGASVENITSASELCFRLHGLLSHKAQGTDSKDFEATCSTLPPKALRGTEVVLDIGGIKTQVADATTADKTDEVNLILPNGVRIYGLGDAFSDYKKDIFVKFDRVDKLDSIVICDKYGIEARDCNTMVIRVTLNDDGSLKSIKK